MFDAYGKEKGVRINYQAIGSGGGIRQVLSKTVDFGGTDAVMKDKKMLTQVLTNHVVSGKLAPDQLAGEHETLAKTKLNVTGSGEKFMVEKANVVCGNVQTANATVYLVDSVLMPPA